MQCQPVRTTQTTSRFPASTTISLSLDPTYWTRPTITGPRSTQSTHSQYPRLPLLCVQDPAAFPTPRPDHNAPTSGVQVWVLDRDCWITSLSKNKLSQGILRLLLESRFEKERLRFRFKYSVKLCPSRLLGDGNYLWVDYHNGNWKS